MTWLEVKLTTTQIGVEFISNIFHELGAGGVVIEDPQLIALYAKRGQWDDYEFPENLFLQEEVVVKGYLPMDQFLLTKLENLKNEVDLLKTRIDNIPVKIDVAEVQEEDWANSWKAYFKPEKIGEKIVIKPSWEEYEPQEEELVIELDPGMAFGTGDHATTALCIKLLEKYMRENMEIIDVGTGSGILSISAAKLGAKDVQALDFDTVAVEVATSNVQINKLENIIKVKHSDLFSQADGKVDLIVANIVADIINKLIPQAHTYLKTQGIFIASGIIDARKEDVLRTFQQNNFDIIEVKEDSGWVAIVAQLRS